MRWFIISTLVFVSINLRAQTSKVNLKDVEIRGQLHKKNTSSFNSQTRADLEKKLYLRRDYKEEILDESTDQKK